MSASATTTSSDFHPATSGHRPLFGWLSAVGMIIFFALALLAYPPLKDAGKPIASPQWVLFFGRFHPIAVHMPVGVLVLAAVMEGLVMIRRRHTRLIESAITFVLGAGALGAIVTAIFGIFLAREGGTFNNGTFYAHQALGIVATILALLAFVVKLIADGSGRFMWPYRLVLGASLFIMSVGAHFGGNMVHGSEYLIEYAPAFIRDNVTSTENAIIAKFAPPKKNDEKKPTAVVKGGDGASAKVGTSADPTVYAALIAPVLEKNCNSCHNEKKSKAKLRMDTYDLLVKGGTSGDNLVPGDTQKSLMISRMTLASDDDDHMPPLKEKQPSKDEVDLLTWWVKEGASNSMKVSEAKLPDNLKALAQTLLSDSKGGSAGGPPPIILSMAEAAAAVDPAVAAAMKKINGTGASLAPVAADSKELRFTALNVAKDYTDANLKDIEPIADKIVALDLAKTKVTDGGCATIAKMVNLRELHLENTAVTDAGAAQLKGLANLEYLNLYGSKITDKALTDLGGLAKLKSLYAWQTGVTKAGADAFKAKHPNTLLNTGWTEADNAKVVAAAAPAAAPAAKAPAPAPAKPAAAPAKPAAAPVAAAAAGKAPDANAVIYKEVIAPILAAKCTKCHGTEKSKGKLRMHTFADLLKGGSDGATTVIPNKVDDSLMIKRIKLADDDDDHMPPKDEKQVTKEELALLTWWVSQGASESMTIAAAKKTPEIEAALKIVGTLKPAAADVAAAKPKAKPLTAEEKKAVADVTAKITALNASLMPLALDTEQLRFGCVNAADKFGDKEVALLDPVAAHVLWVDLSRSKVTDAGLASVAKMANLERLHLENTGITDAGLAKLAGLKNLEYLNLYGTKVTDAGIAKLSGIKTLKKLFVWQTAATKDGAKKLEAAVPGLVVNVGLSEAEIAKLVEEAKPPTPPAAPKADAKAADKAKKPDDKKPAPAAKPEEKKPAPAPAAAKPEEKKPAAAPAPAKPTDAAKPAADAKK